MRPTKLTASQINRLTSKPIRTPSISATRNTSKIKTQEVNQPISVATIIVVPITVIVDRVAAIYGNHIFPHIAIIGPAIKRRMPCKNEESFMELPIAKIVLYVD